MANKYGLDDDLLTPLPQPTPTGYVSPWYSTGLRSLAKSFMEARQQQQAAELAKKQLQNQMKAVELEQLKFQTGVEENKYKRQREERDYNLKLNQYELDVKKANAYIEALENKGKLTPIQQANLELLRTRKDYVLAQIEKLKTTPNKPPTIPQWIHDKITQDKVVTTQKKLEQTKGIMFLPEENITADELAFFYNSLSKYASNPDSIKTVAPAVIGQILKNKKQSMESSQAFTKTTGGIFNKQTVPDLTKITQNTMKLRKELMGLAENYVGDLKAIPIEFRKIVSSGFYTTQEQPAVTEQETTEGIENTGAFSTDELEIIKLIDDADKGNVEAINKLKELGYIK